MRAKLISLLCSMLAMQACSSSNRDSTTSEGASTASAQSSKIRPLTCTHDIQAAFEAAGATDWKRDLDGRPEEENGVVLSIPFLECFVSTPDSAESCGVTKFDERVKRDFVQCNPSTGDGSDCLINWLQTSFGPEFPQLRMVDRAARQELVAGGAYETVSNDGSRVHLDDGSIEFRTGSDGDLFLHFLPPNTPGAGSLRPTEERWGHCVRNEVGFRNCGTSGNVEDRVRDCNVKVTVRPFGPQSQGNPKLDYLVNWELVTRAFLPAHDKERQRHQPSQVWRARDGASYVYITRAITSGPIGEVKGACADRALTDNATNGLDVPWRLFKNEDEVNRIMGQKFDPNAPDKKVLYAWDFLNESGEILSFTEEDVAPNKNVDSEEPYNVHCVATVAAP